MLEAFAKRCLKHSQHSDGCRCALSWKREARDYRCCPRDERGGIPFRESASSVCPRNFLSTKLPCPRNFHETSSSSVCPRNFVHETSVHETSAPSVHETS